MDHCISYLGLNHVECHRFSCLLLSTCLLSNRSEYIVTLLIYNLTPHIKIILLFSVDLSFGKNLGQINHEGKIDWLEVSCCLSNEHFYKL